MTGLVEVLITSPPPTRSTPQQPLILHNNQPSCPKMPPRKKPAPSPQRNGSLLSFFGRGASIVPPSGNPSTADRKGKRKADVGSAADPVVISDEEEVPRKLVRLDPGPSRSGSSSSDSERRTNNRPSNGQQRDDKSHSPERRKGETDEEDETEDALATECMMCGAKLPRDTAVSLVEHHFKANSSPLRRTSMLVSMLILGHERRPLRIHQSRSRSRRPQRPRLQKLWSCRLIMNRHQRR